MGHKLIIKVPHAVTSILLQANLSYLTHARQLSYVGILLSQSHITVEKCGQLNQGTLPSTKAEWMTKLLENKEIVLSNQLPRDSLPVSSRSCSQHPQHARLLNDPRGFIKATQRRLNQSKTHQHLLKVSDKFRLWSSPTSSVRSVGGRVISGNTRDPTPLAEVYSLEATGVSGGREEENTHRNGDARQRTQDSTEGERRDGHRRRQYWTTGCQLTTVTTLCFMFVFSVFLTTAIVSMNMASTDNPCDPHCQQSRKKRSFCRGYCYGVAGARKYDNPCNQTNPEEDRRSIPMLPQNQFFLHSMDPTKLIPHWRLSRWQVERIWLVPVKHGLGPRLGHSLHLHWQRLDRKSPDQQADSNCHYTRPCQPKRNYDVIGTRWHWHRHWWWWSWFKWREQPVNKKKIKTPVNNDATVKNAKSRDCMLNS